MEVLLHDVEVVAYWVQRREREGLAFFSVVAVVVVHADGGDPLTAQGLDQPSCDGRLSRSAVTGNGQHDRAQALTSWLGPVRSQDVHLLVQHPYRHRR